MIRSYQGMSRVIGVILVSLVSMAFFFSAVETACTQPVVKWKVATHRPDEDDATKYLKTIKANVEKRTNGKFTWTLYTGPGLGGWEDIFAGLIAGDVELAYIPFDAGYDPRFQVLYTPFLTTGWEGAFAMYRREGWLNQAYAKIAKLYGLMPLGWGMIGPCAIDTRNKQVKSIDDLKGLKIRVATFPVMMDTWNAWGAIGTPMPRAELYTALQTGVVDGEENCAYTVWMFTKDVQKYYTNLHHTYEALPSIVNLKAWNSLPAEYQKILEEEFETMHEMLNKSARERDNIYVKKLQNEMGWTITTLTPEQRKPFIDKARALWPSFVKYLGKDLVSIMVAQAKKE